MDLMIPWILIQLILIFLLSILGLSSEMKICDAPNHFHKLSMWVFCTCKDEANRADWGNLIASGMI